MDHELLICEVSALEGAKVILSAHLANHQIHIVIGGTKYCTGTIETLHAHKILSLSNQQKPKDMFSKATRLLMGTGANIAP